MSRIVDRAARNPVLASAMQIVKASVDPDVSAASLAELAAEGQEFGTRLLTIVNSPTLGLAHEVQDVKRAASLLGVRALKNLATNLFISQLSPDTAEGQLIIANVIRRGVIAKALAETLGERRPDHYFTGGLFLDAGVLDSDDLSDAARIATRPATNRLLLERAAGLSSHPAQGQTLGTYFHLDPEHLAAIANHHDREPIEGRFAQVMWCAERIAGVFEGGDVSALQAQAIGAALQIGLDDKQARTVLSDVPGNVRSAAEAFHKEIGPQLELSVLLEQPAQSLRRLSGFYDELSWALGSALDAKEQAERELQQALERCARLAGVDELTGLHNGRSLLEALTRDLARAERESNHLSVMVMDLDHFTKLNNTWGHHTGDAVLKEVGKLLADTVRTEDVAGRYKGQRFAMVLANTPEAGAIACAERYRRKLSGTVIKGPKGMLFLTASFGVATISGKGLRDQGLGLIEAAEAALQSAKDGGRNRVCAAPTLVREA